MLQFDQGILMDLVRNKTTLDQIRLGSIQIGERFDVIDFFEIINIELYYSCTNTDYRNNTIKENFEYLHQYGGWVTLAGGLVCEVTNQRIVHLKLSRRFIEEVNHCSKGEITRFHGQPEFELMESSSMRRIPHLVLAYPQKKLYFFLDSQSKLLNAIHTVRPYAGFEEQQ